MNDELLRIYLDDHVSGSVAAVELIEHWLEDDPPEPLGSFLKRLLADIQEDQAVLRDLHDRVGGKESTLKDAAAWMSDKISRLKLNELTGHRKVSRLEKLEELILGVRGKLALWNALDAVTGSDGRFSDVDFDRLKQRAQAQMDEISTHHVETARKAFLEGADEPRAGT